MKSRKGARLKRAMDLHDRPARRWRCCGRLFALIALLIKIDSRGPVFFRQERAGRGNEAVQ